MFSQVFSRTLCYYLYCVTDYHEPFDFNNRRLKLYTVDWSTFIQGDVGGNSETHWAVPSECVLLRSGEAQAPEDFTTLSLYGLTSGALLRTWNLSTSPFS